MNRSDDKPGKPAIPSAAAPSSVDAFLRQAEAARADQERSSRGRLIFALDATASRQATWDLARSLQSRMFESAKTLGGLDVQLVYFRGFGECRASRFVAGGEGLAALMARIEVSGGMTQIGRVLRHVAEESRRGRVGALVYVGDAMEENIDELAALAGEIALLGVKAFLFQEGGDPNARRAFREIARLTGGAYAIFDANAPSRLAALLAAAAAYAAGGRLALEQKAREGHEAAKLLLGQMRPA